MSTDYNDNNLGDISVDNEVIKDIALKAATEVEGINEIGKGLLGKIRTAFTKKVPARGVKLEFTNPTELGITLKLMIEYGINIPDAAAAVQENVKKAVEKMTDLTVDEVAVKIIGMEAQKGR